MRVKLKTKIYLFIYFLIVFLNAENSISDVEVDPNGYLIFCLCMGRIGNQVEHFLGGMDFARKMNRTLILPSFPTYTGSNKNVPFEEWFRVDAVQNFHRAVSADLFMHSLAPVVWPAHKRVAFCWSGQQGKVEPCRMKEGNPFGPFWDGLKVDFVREVNFHSLSTPEEWNNIFPPDQYPVIAMKGAPAPFPMQASLWHLQGHLLLSQHVQQLADDYIRDNFPHQAFIAIHLRNGLDWERACDSGVGQHSFMASPQCHHEDAISREMCLPSASQVLRRVKELVVEEKVRVVFVATDQNAMLSQLRQHLDRLNVKVLHADPDLPLVDWAIMIKADFFIGNCVSSFTSFVKRSRDLLHKPTLFWGID